MPSRDSVIKGISNVNLCILKGKNINVNFSKRLYKIITFWLIELLTFAPHFQD